MDDTKKYAIELTKDIVVAKLNSTNSDTSNRDAGKAIGNMFEEICNKIYEICSTENIK